MTKARLTSNERRAQILENAAKVFAAQGLTGTRTKDIAKACGVNEAVLYNHFEGKDQLFRESFQYIQQDMLDDLDKIANQAPDGFTALKETMHRFAKGLISKPELRAYLLHGFSSMTQDQEMLDWVKGWCQNQDDFIKGLLARGIKDGSIRPDVYGDCTVWHIKGVLWGCMLEAMLQITDTSAEKMSIHLLNNVLDPLAMKYDPPKDRPSDYFQNDDGSCGCGCG